MTKKYALNRVIKMVLDWNKQNMSNAISEQESSSDSSEEGQDSPRSNKKVDAPKRREISTKEEELLLQSNRQMLQNADEADLR